MSDIAFGTTEHIAGLSREALEADFRYVQDRRTELEEACERLQDENDKLLMLMRELLTDPDAWDYDYLKYRMRELGVETGEL